MQLRKLGKKDESSSLRERIRELETRNARLEDSENRLLALFEHAPDAYYLSDSTGTFVDGNTAAEAMTGYARDELIGASFLHLNLLSPRDIPRAASLLARNALGQTTGPERFLLTRKDGSQVPVEVRAQPVKIGGRTLSLGLARDITAREKADQALRKSESKFRNVVESSPMGMHMYQIEADGRLVFASGNRASEQIIGMDNSQFIGKTVEEAFPSLTQTEVPDRYFRAAANGEPWTTEQLVYEDDRISGAFESTCVSN